MPDNSTNEINAIINSLPAIITGLVPVISLLSNSFGKNFMKKQSSLYSSILVALCIIFIVITDRTINSIYKLTPLIGFAIMGLLIPLFIGNIDKNVFEREQAAQLRETTLQAHDNEINEKIILSANRSKELDKFESDINAIKKEMAMKAIKLDQRQQEVDRQAANIYVNIAGKEYPISSTSIDLSGKLFGSNGLTSNDLSELHRFYKLESLHLENNRITNLTSVAKVSTLKRLRLSGNKITDLSPLCAIPHLIHLDIGANPIEDFTTVRCFTDLEYFGIINNDKFDTSVLSDMRKLKELQIRNCGLTSIVTLSELKDLNKLDLNTNRLTDISTLGNLTGLTWLDITANHHLEDIGILRNLPNLKYLRLVLTAITDFTPVEHVEDVRGMPDYTELSV